MRVCVCVCDVCVCVNSKLIRIDGLWVTKLTWKGMDDDSDERFRSKPPPPGIRMRCKTRYIQTVIDYTDNIRQAAGERITNYKRKEWVESSAIMIDDWHCLIWRSTHLPALLGLTKANYSLPEICTNPCCTWNLVQYNRSEPYSRVGNSR